MGYEEYKLELLRKLKYFKIPESDYSLNGEKTGNCIFVKQAENSWHVCQSKNNEQITRGIFNSKYDAYDFLFYLVMKNHVNIKKSWW